MDLSKISIGYQNGKPNEFNIDVSDGLVNQNSNRTNEPSYFDIKNKDNLTTKGNGYSWFVYFLTNEFSLTIEEW